MQKFADKLIERLEELRKEYYKDYNLYKCERDLGNVDGLKHAIEIVNQLAEEYKSFGNSEQVNDGWIACSERVPEKGGSYIVYSKTGSVYLAHYYKNSIVPHWSKNSGNIIAWQPLPQPYRPKEESHTPPETWKQQTMNRFERVE